MEEIGRFVYRESKIPQFGRHVKKPSIVTVFADPVYRIFFPYFVQVINEEIDLDTRSDHRVDVELIADQKFKFLIDNAKTYTLLLDEWLKKTSS